MNTKKTNSDSKISTLDDAPDELLDAPAPKEIVGTNHDAELSGDTKSITIFEQAGDGGSDAVFISVNGVGYLIPRGTPHTVPAEVVSALDNCVQDIFESLPNGETKKRQLKRFNYTVHASRA